MLNSLTTNSTVNGKRIENAIPLHGDVQLYGPITFTALSVENLYTNDEISGINFNQWHDKSVWKTGRDVQLITANWTIHDATFRSSIDGSGTVNGEHIQEISARIYDHTPRIADNLQAFHRDYHDVCGTLTDLVDKTQKDLYVLSQFDTAFKIKESLPIASVYSFDAMAKQYLLTNFGCQTKLYFWQRDQKKFNYLCEIETGPIESWIHATDASTSSWYLISNSGAINKQCRISGVNVWKFDGQILSHFPSKVGTSPTFGSIQRNPNHPRRFYVLHHDNSTVYDYDLQGNVIEKWHLPSHGDKFRFLPQDVGLGLAFSDGHLLSVLSSIKARIERTSQWIDHLPDDFSDEKNVSKRFFFSDDTNARIQSVKDRYVMSQQAKLKAMSLAGPFTNISIGRNLDFFNEVLGNGMRNDVTNKGVHLKIQPSEILPHTDRPYFERLFDSNGEKDRVASAVSTDNPMIGDQFGRIEELSKELADKVVDNLVDVNRGTGGSIGGLVNRLIDVANETVVKSHSIGPGNTTEPMVGDAFGELEELSKRIGDELVDAIVDLNSDTDGAVKDLVDGAAEIGETVYEDYHESGGFLGGTISTTAEPIVGDTFGELEELSKRIADEVVDTIVDLNGDTDGAVADVIDGFIDIAEPLYEDYHESGGFLGGSAGIQMTTTGGPIVGDAFGELEELSKRIADEVVDSIADINEDSDGAISGLIDGAVDIAEDLYQDYHDEGGFLGSAKFNETSKKTNKRPSVGGTTTDLPLGGTFGHAVKSVTEAVSHGYHKTKDYVSHKFHHHHHNKTVHSNHSAIANQSETHSHHNHTHHPRHHHPHHHHHHHNHHHHHHDDDKARTVAGSKYQEKPDEYLRTINTGLPSGDNMTHLLSKQNTSMSEYDKDHLPTIPRITLANIDDHIHGSASSPSSKHLDDISVTTDSIFLERTISKEILSGGLVTAENEYLPGYGQQEIAVLRVDNIRKTFVAVSSLKENVVQGMHDSILVGGFYSLCDEHEIISF